MTATKNITEEVSQDVQRKRTMTRMQKRDLRDAMSLAVSSIGTAISIVALMMASPRSDPEATRLAEDVSGYLASRGLDGYTPADIRMAISTPEGVGLVMDALDAISDGSGTRGLIPRLRAHRAAMPRRRRGSNPLPFKRSMPHPLSRPDDYGAIGVKYVRAYSES